MVPADRLCFSPERVKVVLNSQICFLSARRPDRKANETPSVVKLLLTVWNKGVVQRANRRLYHVCLF